VISAAISDTALMPVSGRQIMGFNAVRLDRDEEMSTISHADIDPP
jgi:hypothetical protein